MIGTHYLIVFGFYTIHFLRYFVTDKKIKCTPTDQKVSCSLFSVVHVKQFLQHCIRGFTTLEEGRDLTVPLGDEVRRHVPGVEPQ